LTGDIISPFLTSLHVDFKNIPQMKKSLQTRSYGVDDNSMKEGNEDVIAVDGGGSGGWIVRGYGSN